jgi:hypothetical protein
MSTERNFDTKSRGKTPAEKLITFKSVIWKDHFSVYKSVASNFNNVKGRFSVRRTSQQRTAHNRPITKEHCAVATFTMPNDENLESFYWDTVYKAIQAKESVGSEDREGIFRAIDEVIIHALLSQRS